MKSFRVRYVRVTALPSTPESFGTIKEVCKSSESGVEGKAVPLTYLTRKDFKGFSPLKQGLCIRLLPRQVKQMSVFVANTTGVMCIALLVVFFANHTK